MGNSQSKLNPTPGGSGREVSVMMRVLSWRWPGPKAGTWESLSQNHAFVDGNKRSAVTMTAAFPRVIECAIAGSKLIFSHVPVARAA